MLMRMVYDEKLAQAAYVLGCQGTGEAIVIDPLRDVDRYIEIATCNDLRIVAVAETHIHADFVSGARELADRISARVFVSGEGGEGWQTRWLDAGPHDGVRLRDGDTFEIGGVELTAIHTPGHTPEHMSYLVRDVGGGATEAMALITGDFLFVGDLGRPDLLETAAGVRGVMESSARELWSSVRGLDRFEDFLQVWPGHGSGSACGKALGAIPTSTLGYERRLNAAIRAAEDEDAFVRHILDGQPEPPAYFGRMKRENRDGPGVLGGLPTPTRCSAADLSKIDPSTASIVDTRPWDAFRAGHVPGSLSFPVSRSFPTDAGSMLDADQEVYLVVALEHLDEVVRDLVRVGIDRISGWCAADEVDAMNAEATSTISEVSVEEAHAMLGAGNATVLDVRRATEFAESRIGGAVNIAHTRLALRLDDVPTRGPVLVNCRSGKRSARAAAYLKRAGVEAMNIAGGILAWEAAGLPTDRG